MLAGGSVIDFLGHLPIYSLWRQLKALRSASSKERDMHHVGTAKTRRERTAHMSPAEFIALVAAWVGGLLLLSSIATVARYLS
jgi:hypothetical protein